MRASAVEELKNLRSAEGLENPEEPREQLPAVAQRARQQAEALRVKNQVEAQKIWIRLNGRG